MVFSFLVELYVNKTNEIIYITEPDCVSHIYICTYIAIISIIQWPRVLQYLYMWHQYYTRRLTNQEPQYVKDQNH